MFLLTDMMSRSARGPILSISSSIIPNDSSETILC